jgi:hypothetical protein
MKPTLEEARKDLADILAEVDAMRIIHQKSVFLSRRSDVNASYYLGVSIISEGHATRGSELAETIKRQYPELA